MNLEGNRYAPLFDPIHIGGVEIKNRFFMAPMGNFGHVDAEGALTDEGIDYFVERAKGGAGLLITGYCIADEEIEGAQTPSIMVIKKNPLIFIQKCSQLTERVHAFGAKIFLQLTAGFGRTAMVVKVTKHIAPSDCQNFYDPSIHHRAMTVEEIHDMVKSFGKAAALAKKCGFDGVEIHALHEDYLLDQFTLSCWNQRTDEYGGSLENRYRVPCEIVQEIKRVCGPRFPVTLRYSVKSYIRDGRSGILPGDEDTVPEMGRTLEEGLEAAKLLEAAGYDGFDADIGSCEAHYLSHPNVFTKDGLYLDAAAQLAQVVQVPVMVAGRMDDPDLPLDAATTGKCQTIGLARTCLAHPYLPEKIRRGHPEQVRRCISCNHGCINNIMNKSIVWCAINPQCYAERRNALRPILRNRKILVVGGGPAGMQAALTCAERGYRVTLVEKKDHLGGNLVYAGATLEKKHILELIRWYEGELRRNNVEILTNCEADAAFVENFGADVVFVGTGSTARAFHIPGADLPQVHFAHEVYYHPEQLGQKVTIIGAGQIGMETAVWLAKMGKQVSVVEFTGQIMGGRTVTPISDIEMVELYIEKYHIDLRLHTKAVEITPNHVVVEGVEDGQQAQIPADTVLVCVGYQSVNGLYKQLSAESRIPDLYSIGDSEHVANIYAAIHSAFEIANSI